MRKFPQFVSLSLLYFAAVSYSETVKRLGKPHLASSFLLCDHPTFGPRLTAFFERLQTSQRVNAQDILTLIEPFNVAGLGDSARRNWYPVEANDLLCGASKLGAAREEILEFLDRSGFWA
jgi:FADH2 O2-dependent halogenase